SRQPPLQPGQAEREDAGCRTPLADFAKSLRNSCVSLASPTSPPSAGADRQNRSMRVAISGAGVAGAALAHWLHRTGHAPTMIEQAPKFRTGGYMIDFWGVGYQVAKRMGIEDPIRAAGYQIEWLRSVGCRGEVKADVDVNVF